MEYQTLVEPFERGYIARVTKEGIDIYYCKVTVHVSTNEQGQNINRSRHFNQLHDELDEIDQETALDIRSALERTISKLVDERWPVVLKGTSPQA